jgi:hypothetical protein
VHRTSPGRGVSSGASARSLPGLLSVTRRRRRHLQVCAPPESIEQARVPHAVLAVLPHRMSAPSSSLHSIISHDGTTLHSASTAPLLQNQNPPFHTPTHNARTLTNQHGSHRQCRRSDATELAHADMTTLPKVDTSCTALSLMRTIIGNTFAASLRTDISPQRKEARPLSHALTSD